MQPWSLGLLPRLLALARHSGLQQKHFHPACAPFAPPQSTGASAAFTHIGRWLQAPGLRHNGNRCHFFPGTSRHIISKEHHFVVGPYERGLKPLALFTAPEVERYLAKKFPPTLARRFLGLLDRDDPVHHGARDCS